MDEDLTQAQSFGDKDRSKQLSVQIGESPTIPGYRIQRPVGTGAFGQVWLATDLNTGRPVAIKCYRSRANLDLDALEREVGMLVNMSTGRHIVQVMKVGWDHEPPYFVMEYLENGSLEDLIRHSNHMSAAQCEHFVREIAAGLEFAHSKGVIHCDLKPANVLLDHAMHPRIADFGQGRMAGDSTHSLGTLFYMAPEQVELEAVPDVKWDVYALGAMAYSLLVGSPPYRSSTVTDSLAEAGSVPDRLTRYRNAIIASPKPTQHYRRRGIDRQLAQIVDGCLHVDPHYRFQNVQQVIGALDQRLQSRTRRPLLLLGIIGPLLLMILMLLFSARSRMLAVNRSEASVIQRAIESNQFAARYAARTLQSEIQTLYSIAEDEADRGRLRELLQSLCSAADSDLKVIGSGQSDSSTVQQLRNRTELQQLQEYLQTRMDRLAVDKLSGRPLLNSIFVNEAHGINVGIVFANDSERDSAVSPVGRNFAYRSYFSGKRFDDIKGSTTIGNTPTRQTSLSASFRSTSTGAWKIAVSTPIWSDDARDTDVTLPIGVLVMTINLGDFQLLSESSQPQSPPERFATLFDGRTGNQQGTLLQHPFISAMDRERMKTVLIPQLSAPVIEDLVQSGLSDFRDPVAQFEDGSAYAGSWIASAAQVELPRSVVDESHPEKSDLWILVQERKDKVTLPIQSLARRLEKEILIEFVVTLAVTLLLWFFVSRMNRSINLLGKKVAEEPSHDALTVEHRL